MPAAAKAGAHYSSGSARTRPSWLRGLNVERSEQPRNNHLLENEGVGPDLYLAAQVAARWIDPRIFWNVAFAEQQINI